MKESDVMKKFISRLISSLLAVAVFAGCFVYSYAETVKYGDVDGNNTINSSDALVVLSYSVGKNTLESMAYKRADVNADGVVNSSDALEILMYCVGKITEFDVQNAPDPEHPFLEKLKVVGDAIGVSLNIVYDEETDSYTVKSKGGVDTGLLGYKYSIKDGIFYTAEDSWQRNFGFNEMYDSAAAIGVMTYNTFRVRYTCPDKFGKKLEWMIQFWKGQYGYAFIGSEIGVYTREVNPFNTSTHYECADDDHKFYMTMDVYRENPDKPDKFNHLFTRSRVKTWWCTGFVLGTLGFAQTNVPDENGTAKLMVDSRIEFDTPEMASAFADALSEITVIENNSVLSGSKRPVSFVKYNTEFAYKTSTETCKYCICRNSTDRKMRDVRVCYR